MSDIVVIGSINMDLVVKTQRIPQAGETITGSHFATIPGGKGANQAAAIARLGGSVSLIGCRSRLPPDRAGIIPRPAI
jgi:ribokinase